MIQQLDIRCRRGSRSWRPISRLSHSSKHRQFHRDFPGRNAPTRVSILCLLNKFRETGMVQEKNKGHSGRLRSARTDPNIDNVGEHLAMSPRKSTRRLSQETDLSGTSLRRIMHQDLHMFPYKIQILQAHTSQSRQRGLPFVRASVGELKTTLTFWT